MHPSPHLLLPCCVAGGWLASFPLRPADYSIVLQGDHLTLLQSLQGDEHPVCSVGIVELQYRKRRHSHLSFLLGYTNAVTPERRKGGDLPRRFPLKVE